jgi:hypothetical protein
MSNPKILLGAVTLCTSLALLSVEARAAKVPIAFDPSLGAQPARTQQKLTALENKLPASFALPATLKPLQSGNITLSFFPMVSAQLERTGQAGTTPMVWPGGTPVLCAKHATFTVPATLLATNAAPQCTTAETVVRQKLAPSSTACIDVEQPERYVLSAPPAVVNDTTTASIESLIGLAGEALSHYPAPEGLLPTDWVPTLRSVVWKIRRAALTQQIATSRASYKDALTTLGAQSSCFDPAARAALTTAVNDLDAELAAADAHVAQVEAKGKAAADQENVCLAAKGRKREDALPFPSLTAEERKLVAFWIGGIYWRMRGGGLIPLGSTQNARRFFLERPFRRIGELAGAARGSEVGFKIYLGIFDGWGEWMDMGTTPGGQDLYEDLVQMTDRGRQQVADPPNGGLPIPLGVDSATKYLNDAHYDTTALITGGLSMGPCYAYALDPLQDFRYADTPMAPYNGELIEYFTAIGEFCTGASIGLGMAETLLAGAEATPVSACGTKTCGDDGCGGSCGTCSNGTTCESGTCVGACVPSCEGKPCGDDGCGGSCGTCNPNASPAGSASPSSQDEDVAHDSGCSTTPNARTNASLVLLSLTLALVARRRRK